MNQEQREKHLDDKKKWITEQLQQSVKDDKINAGNIDYQLGRSMLPAELEKKLLLLNPNFRFEHSPNTTKKRLYYKESFLCLYENSLMPEHSIMSIVEED